MPTVRDIVTRAYHRGGIVALGRDPKASEAEFGLETLQSIYDEWVENGMFGQLTDVYETSNYTADEWDRVISPSAITVTKPTTIADEGDRAPYELSCIVTVLNGATTSYIYTRGEWVSLTGLTLDSEAPLATYGRAGLEALLMTRMFLPGQAQITPDVYAQARRFQGRIMWKFGQDRTLHEAEDY